MSLSKPNFAAMKYQQKEILPILSQFKAEINRVLTNTGSKLNIGYTYTRGKSPCIYFVDTQDGNRVIENIATVNTGNELIEHMRTICYTIKTVNGYM